MKQLRLHRGLFASGGLKGDMKKVQNLGDFSTSGCMHALCGPVGTCYVGAAARVQDPLKLMRVRYSPRTQGTSRPLRASQQNKI